MKDAIKVNVIFPSHFILFYIVSFSLIYKINEIKLVETEIYAVFKDIKRNGLKNSSEGKNWKSVELYGKFRLPLYLLYFFHYYIRNSNRRPDIVLSQFFPYPFFKAFAIVNLIKDLNGS